MSDYRKFEERLARWPYAYRQLLQTPTNELIERHAVSHLCRALNIGRVTAFVGSGASMAYGRISWSDMIYVTQQSVFQKYEENKEDLKEKYHGFARIEALKNLLDKHKVDRTEPDAGHQLIVFQLAEELDSGIDQGFSAPSLIGDATKRERNTFRGTVMWLTRDDRGHAEQLIKDALLDADLEHDGQVTVANASEVSRLVKEALWGATELEGRTIPDFPSDQPYHDRIRRPLERYLIGAYLRSLPMERRREAIRDLKSAREEEEERQKADVAAPRKKREERSEKIDPERDPLLTVLDRLEIRRFLTVNYDSEIELLFDDEGFVRAATRDTAKASKTVTDPRAHTFTDVVFSRDRSADLVTLAARDKSQSAWVVHLHGRAELDEKGAFLVATDEDYRVRYAQIDDKTPIINDSIRLTFGASPILFLGIGMEEVDLLRPLREFMGGRSGFNDRLVVALLPHNDDKQKTERKKIEFLRKYGIYTIHYGVAHFPEEKDKDKDKDKEKEKEKDKREVPWLALLNDVKKALDSFLDELASAKKLQSAFARHDDMIRDILSKKVALVKALKHQYDWMNPGAPDRGKDIRSLLVPAAMETMCAEGETVHTKIEDELSQIHNAVRFALDLADSLETTNIPFWPELRREASAHKVRVAGAANALKTTALSARLTRLKQEWTEWRNEFFQLPQARPFISKNPFTPPKLKRITSISRHWIKLPEVKDVDLLMERFYAGAPSQTFNYLISAISSHKSAIAKQRGRRIFLLVSSRGTGKGHFFSALQQTEVRGRLDTLLTLIRPKRSTEYTVAFFNLSFSVEVSSIFDRIAEFLWDPSRKPPQPGDTASVRGAFHNESANERNWRELSGNRLERLRLALRKLSDKGAKTDRRFLIAFNAINFLFDRDGAPKNQQFGELFDALLEFPDAPIDYIFICSNQAVPRQFRNKHSGGGHVEPARADLQMRVLNRQNPTEREVLENRAVIQASLDISLNDGQTRNFVHVLHPARASVVLSAFFPSVALLVAWATVERINARKESKSSAAGEDEARKFLKLFRIGDRRKNRFNVMKPSYARHIREKLKTSLGVDSGVDHWLVNNQRIVLPYVMLAAALLFEVGAKPSTGPCDLGELVRKLRKRKGKPKNATEVEDLIQSELLGVLHRHVKFDKKSEDVKKAFRYLAAQIDAKLREMYEAVSNMRFAFSLWMAMAYEILFQAIGQDDLTNFIDNEYRTLFRPQATAAFDFISSTIDKLRQHGRQRKDAILIDLIFAQLKRQHEMQDKLHKDKQPKTPMPIPRGIKRGVEFYDLQSTILWHLAVIGIPIEADILARCPLIRETINRAREGAAARGHGDYEACVKEAMPLLVTRCLAFKLSPFGEMTKEPRYGVHHSLQRHFFHKMGAPFIDSAEVDQFSLTLYAHQPDEIPKLLPIAHRDLRRTVWALSGYPEDDESADIYDETDPNGTKDHGLRGRMLRAAYGIVRSIYSVSCLARFNVEHEETGANGFATLFSGSPGIFEEHRRQIRWLLKEAIELTRNNKNAYVPYYAEEIVWLYNESAILSLIQGCLPDAVALFHLADRAAARIEPSPTGPLRALILLNRSVAEIERGRLAWARDALERIVAAVDYDKDPDTHIIAEGYLALVYHLKGNTGQAVPLYEKVILDLTRRGRSRAAAIFSRHHGDLLRSSGEDRQIAAKHRLESAVKFSAEGRHEDIRQLAMLSRARLLLSSADASKSADIHAMLSSVERYACAMGMPRLLTEIEEIRARLYRQNGDLRSAGSAASNSLEIASLNELRLRKASCLGLLAGIDLDRGFASECETLRQEALALAEEIGYEAVLVAAHELGHRLQGGALSRPSGN